jgi:hypothetical protein
MSITEVRSKFHRLIDEVENPVLLERFLEILEQSSQNKDSKLWNTLASSEKSEVLKSYEESKDESMLIAHEEVMSKYSKWRKK